MRSQSILKVLLFLYALLLLSACGGGGGGDNNPTPPAGTDPAVAALAGTWFGVLEDPNFVLHRISVVVNSAGKVTEERIDDVVQTGLTADISEVSGQIFSFVFSDGTEGGFIVDASGIHAGFLDDGFNFGVLQKGATSLPVYANANLVGSWSGYGVTVDNAFNIAAPFNSSATVNTGGTFTGSDTSGGAFSGALGDVDPEFGRFFGDVSNDSDPTNVGFVGVFLSVDMLFVASYACFDDNNDGFFTPDECSFTAWNK